MRFRDFALLAVVLIAVSQFPAPTMAQPSGVPAASNSTIPSVLATTPGGNITSVVIVRDLAGNPVTGSQVVIDYNNCAGFVPCSQGAGSPSDGYVVDLPTKTIRMFSSVPQGRAAFALRAGGGCSGNGIRIFADGVLLGSIHAASADQNGDLSVDGADVAAVHAKLGTADLSGDLDGNFVVDAADELAVTGYVGVNCLDPTKVRHPSWGSVKTIYR